MRGPVCTDQMELLQDMLLIVMRGSKWEMLIVGPAVCVCVCVCVCVRAVFSHICLFATPWTVTLQAPLSMGILQARMLECSI